MENFGNNVCTTNLFVFVLAVNMIFDSIDDLRCLENISNEDDYTRNALFEDKQLHALLEVSTKKTLPQLS